MATNGPLPGYSQAIVRLWRLQLVVSQPGAALWLVEQLGPTTRRSHNQYSVFALLLSPSTSPPLRPSTLSDFSSSPRPGFK